MSRTVRLGSAKKFITEKWAVIALILIFLAGSWLRFDGALWGLPLRLHPDEGRIVDNAIDMANSHRFEVTGDFNHPNHTPIKLQVLTFWAMRHAMTAVSIAQLPEDAVIAGIEQFEKVPLEMQKLPPKSQLFLLNCSDNHQITFGRENDNSLYVGAGRILSAFAGVTCIFFAWLIGKQIHKGLGVICAFLFAFYPNLVEHSHYITPEIYQTAFTLAMIYFAIIYVKNQKFRILFLACFCAALAFCTKYTALFSFPVVLASIICANSQGSQKQIKTRSSFQTVWKNIYTCILAFIMLGICVFTVSPILLLDLPSVYVNVMSEARATHLGADGFGYWDRLLFYIKCYANHSGMIIVAFTILGFVHMQKKNRSIFFLLLPAVLYAPITAILSLHWDRWGVPFYAFLLIFASIGMWKVFEWLKSIFSEYLIQHKKMPKIKGFLSVAAAILSIISLSSLILGSVAKSMYFAITQDTRIASGDYVSDLGVTKDNTYFEGYTPLKPTDPAMIFSEFEGMDISKPLNPRLKYIILSSDVYARYYAEPGKYESQVAFYDALKAKQTVIRTFDPVVIKESPNDAKNITNSLKVISGFLKGGYSGPTLIFYEYR